MRTYTYHDGARRYQDLANATLHNPDPVAMRGPILADAEFPEVLVAKAYSHDSKALDTVLYQGKQAGVCKLGFERLTPGGKYKVGKDQTIADQYGYGSADVAIDGRTQALLLPAQIERIETWFCSVRWRWMMTSHSLQINMELMIAVYLFKSPFVIHVR